MRNKERKNFIYANMNKKVQEIIRFRQIHIHTQTHWNKITENKAEGRRVGKSRHKGVPLNKGKHKQTNTNFPASKEKQRKYI